MLKAQDCTATSSRLWNLESLVVTFLHFEASDTRDTIYALLSLANDGDLFLQAGPASNLQKQDYTKSTEQVYAEFVQHCVKSSDSLDIICRYWALAPKGQSNLELPNWIGLIVDSPFGPSPRGTGRLNGDSLVGKPSCKIYNASRGSHPLVRLHIPDVHREPNSAARQPNLRTHEVTGNDSESIFTIKPNITLFARGFRLCRITQVSSRVVDGIISHDCLKIAGWDLHDDINNIPDRLWRTLVADRAQNGSYAPS